MTNKETKIIEFAAARSNKETAREFGISPGWVSQLRRKHNLPRSKHDPLGPNRGTQAIIVFLMTHSDREGTEKFGITRQYCSLLRITYGLPRVNGRHSPEGKETPELVAKLGTKPDKDLAKEFDLSAKTVGCYRRIYGISLLCQERVRIQRQYIRRHPPIQWGDRTQLARKLKMTKNDISHALHVLHLPLMRRGIPPELIDRLGTLPDRALAREFGVSPGTVCNHRHKRNIPSYKNVLQKYRMKSKLDSGV